MTALLRAVAFAAGYTLAVAAWWLHGGTGDETGTPSDLQEQDPIAALADFDRDMDRWYA